MATAVWFMCLGAKEIDIAATLEHIRDQRINMVRSKVRRVVFIRLSLALVNAETNYLIHLCQSSR